jgi:hypothetical protein
MAAGFNASAFNAELDGVLMIGSKGVADTESVCQASGASIIDAC